MRKQERGSHECHTLQDDAYESLDSAYNSMSSSLMSTVSAESALDTTSTVFDAIFYSWESYHRSDKSKSGQLFLYIYLRDLPGRRNDAELVLQQYFEYNGVSENGSTTTTKELSIDDLSEPSVTAVDKSPTTDLAAENKTPDKAIAGTVTPKINPVDASVSSGDDIDSPVKAALSLSSDVRDVQLYADINDWQPVSMTLESGKRTWSLHVSPKLGEYKFLVHEANGTSFWATDSQSMVVRKPPIGSLNNITKYEGGPVFAIERDDDGTTELTIKSNVNCAFASNYHKFQDAQTVAVHTNVDWSVAHDMKLVDGDWTVTLPPRSHQCKFVLDGYRWTTLDQMPFVGNQGWNCNNVLHAVYRQI